MAYPYLLITLTSRSSTPSQGTLKKPLLRVRLCRPKTTVSRLFSWIKTNKKISFPTVISCCSVFFFFFFITYRRWGQSTNQRATTLPIPRAVGLKGPTHISPVHAYEFLSRCRFSTPTPRQPTIELPGLTSSRYPLRKPEQKFTPAESRTHKFRPFVSVCCTH